jgi:8-hydroxy-5-deazaflavin:NADPH oxidoreductase
MERKVGILGSGSVGRALARGFSSHGYHVMIGSGTGAKRDELRTSLGNGIAVGAFAETANFGELLVIAVKGTAAEQVLMAADVSNLAGKTVMDATNPIADKPPTNGVITYFTSHDESLMERLQRKVPTAHFVKAFSCVGAALMVNPDFNGLKPTMFICGNDEGAKADVKQILQRFGWDNEDMGGVEAARAIEPLAMLWCIPGFREN